MLCKPLTLTSKKYGYQRLNGGVNMKIMEERIFEQTETLYKKRSVDRKRI